MPVKHLPSVLVCLSMFLLLLMGDTAGDAVSASLELCVTGVIPSLFPYMVLSSLIISMDLFHPLCRRIPMERWFGLPRCTASVMLTGFLCGFPVGASGSAQLVRDGKLSSADASKLCAMASVASPAFVIGTAGQLWTREYGLLLWLTQIAVSLFLGAGFLRGSAASPDTNTEHFSSRNFSECLCRSISSAAHACLNVTAYITFFGTAAELLSKLFPPLSPLFTMMLEFSRGVFCGAQTGGLPGILFTGAAVGFSGVSVLMQTASFLIPENIPLRPYFITRLIAAIVSSAVSALYYLCRLPTSSPLPASGTVFSPLTGFFMITVLGILPLLANSLFGRKKHTEKCRRTVQSRCK